MPVFCQALEKWGQMSHTTEKYGDIGNFFGVTYVILPFVNLKLVGTWAPTAKIIGDIPDFNVLNVPKTQPRHNPECYTTSRCITDHQTDSLEVLSVNLSQSEMIPAFQCHCLFTHWSLGQQLLDGLIETLGHHPHSLAASCQQAAIHQIRGTRLLRSSIPARCEEGDLLAFGARHSLGLVGHCPLPHVPLTSSHLVSRHLVSRHIA